MKSWLINTDNRTLKTWDANGWTRLEIGDEPVQGDRVLVYLHDRNQFPAVGVILGPTDQPGVLRVEPLVLFDWDWVDAAGLRADWPPLKSASALPEGVTEITRPDFEYIYTIIHTRAEAAGLA
ncbi:MAG: hypothetical protein M5U01_05685 [Ardenticatenaceae bacterium]|nr:hypothetical protein [Ardenticatenaceae bacterium]